MPTSGLVKAGTPNDGLPSSFVPIEQAAVIAEAGPQSAPRPSVEGAGPYFTASIPQQMQLTTDVIKPSFAGGLGGYRVMPPGPSGVPAVVSATKSIVENVSTLSTPSSANLLSVAFMTDGIPNGSQAGVNFVGSSVNAIGLVVSPVNALGDQEAFEITGTLSPDALPDSGVTAGSYTNTDITVNAAGIITAASNGSGGGGTLQGPYEKTTTLVTTTISSSSPVTVLQLSIAIPATGGPYRIFVSYALFTTSSYANNGAFTWVTDGTNSWAPDGFDQTGQNGKTITLKMTELSEVTYAAGSGTILLSLEAQGTESGSTLTAVSDALVGPCVSFLSAEVIASN